MKIVEVTSKVFTYKTNKMSDTDGHTHPGPERQAKMALLTVTADDGTQGHVTGNPHYMREDLLNDFIRPVLVGQDSMRIEKLWYGLYKWQRGSGGRLTDRVVCAAELALWDLVGKKLGQPVPLWNLASEEKSGRRQQMQA